MVDRPFEPPSAHMLSIARAKHSKLMTLTGSTNAMLVKYCLMSVYGNAAVVIIGTIALHIDTVYSSIMIARSASPMSKSLLPAVKILWPSVQGLVAPYHTNNCWKKTLVERNGRVMKMLNGSMSQASFWANPGLNPSKFPL